jgi:hypothetical protein
MLFGIASLISLALFLPYRFNVYRMQGSGLNDASCYARDFANAEFKGRAGFPRAKVTLKEYYFKMHKPADLVLYQVAGVAGIFYFLSEQIFNVIQEQNHLAKAFMKEKINGLRRYPLLSFKVVSLSLFMLFCIVSCLFNGKFRIILYIIVLSNLPNLFLYGATLIKAHAVIQAQRTIAQALPFVAFLISGFIYSVFNKHSLFKKNAGI